MLTVDEIEQLKRERDEFKRERDQFRRERDESEREKVQFKRERDESERKNEDLEHRLDKSEALTRPTTLGEYLIACHELVLSGIKYSVYDYLTSKTPATNPTNKHCPRLLTPWLDFEETQAKTLTELNKVFPGDRRLFESIHFLQRIGDRLHDNVVSGETSLAFVQNNSVEHPVRIVYSHLKDVEPGRLGLAAFDKIVFETSAASLRDEKDGTATVDAADMVERDKKLRTDQICLSRRVGEQRNIAYVIEYKAPHRLHTQHLEKGLRAMNIVEEVVSKPTVPKADPARFQHYSELLATAAVTQTYHYMIEAGLEYGYLTNGESFVFLRIDWDNPAVLYYHLSQPSREVEANGDPEVNGAVSQVLAFSAVALCSTQKSNDVRVAAADACQTYQVDFNSLLHQVTELEEKFQDANATSRSTTTHRRVPSDPDWIPRPVKKTKRQADASSGDVVSDRVLRPRDRQDSPDADAGGMHGGGTGSAVSGSGQGQAGSGTSGSASGTASGMASGTASGTRSHNHTAHASTQPSTADLHGKACRKAYCTPLCLLSLVNGGALDKKCPNVSLHGGKAGGKGKGQVQKHPVSYAQWTTLLRAELTQSLDKGVLVLGKEGACGALFQVSLLQYGYTFVAKGGTGRSIPKLQKEHAIYERLGPLQGRNIPVCLGLINLRELKQVYYYDFDVRIVYFLLLSFGGEPFAAPPTAAVEARVRSTIKSVVDEMHRLGVIHGDIALRNVLRGPNNQPVLIDFDKGRLMPVEATVTQNAKKRKRPHCHNGGDEDSMAKLAASNAVATPATLDAETRVLLYQDKANAQSFFVL